jgi:hypothetical protein
MLQSADLKSDLEGATHRLGASSHGSAEFQRLADELSEVGHRITESIEHAFVELTSEQDEAA